MTFPDINDFFLAYRKVKAELWHMRGIPYAKELSDYEENLLDNLERLRASLGSGVFQPTDDFLGIVYSLPKKIELPEDSKKPKLHFSPIKDDIPRPSPGNKITLHTRLVARPSIEFQILGVLWIMEHGEKVDRRRSPASRSNILRRHRSQKTPLTPDEGDEAYLRGEINKGYPGVYRPYFDAYKRWRSDGIKKIKSALSNGQRVFAITLDLKRFYHQIDAKCVPDFIPAQKSKIADAFYKSLEKWQEIHGEIASEDGKKLGIPVGLIASPLIANIVLSELDEVITTRLSPIYYGRYVDDIFLVLNLNGKFPDGASVFQEIAHLSSLAPASKPRIKFNKKTRDISFKCLKWKDCKFESKASKQKIFQLEGSAGLDFISVIQQAALENSSEWRMVPDLDEATESQLAEALVVSHDATDEPNTLRKADTLSLRRLGVSVALRKLEAIERFNLKPSDWLRHRESFYKLLLNHVLTPQGVCEFWPNIPRAFGLALSQGDWKWITRFVSRIRESIDYLSQLNGGGYDGSSFWDWLSQVLKDEICKVGPSQGKRSLNQFRRTLGIFGDEIFWSILKDLPEIHRKLKARDLDRYGLRQRFRAAFSKGDEQIGLETVREAAGQLEAVIQGESVYTLRDSISGSTSALFLPTRPLSELDLCLMSAPNHVDLDLIKTICANLRGSTYSSIEEDHETSESSEQIPALGKPKPIIITPEFKAKGIRVAITNYLTTDDAWEKRVRGTPTLSYLRLKGLFQLIDNFLRGIKKLHPAEKPLYFFLPELSVPPEWLMMISGYLANARVSFIAGAEYEALPGNQLANMAYLFLRSRDFRFPSTVLLKQKKTRPAVGESAGLAKFGKSFSGCDPSEVPFYKHGDFHFGVLLCSELMDAEFQYHFRSHVDAVICLEWNPDIESFSALVEASALTVHSYIIQINNRKYGDSRVRSPAKPSHKRDIIRLRGGDHDYYVIGSLDIHALRDYQRASIPDQGDKAEFKPTPPGFDHTNSRLK